MEVVVCGQCDNAAEVTALGCPYCVVADLRAKLHAAEQERDDLAYKMAQAAKRHTRCIEKLKEAEALLARYREALEDALGLVRRKRYLSAETVLDVALALDDDCPAGGPHVRSRDRMRDGTIVQAECENCGEPVPKLERREP